MADTGNRPATGLAAPCRTRLPLPLPLVPHHPNRLLQQPVSHRHPRSGTDGRDPSSDSLPRQAAHSMRGVAAAVPPPRPERRAAKSSAHHRFRTSASGAAYPLGSRIPNIQTADRLRSARTGRIRNLATAVNWSDRLVSIGNSRCRGTAVGGGHPSLFASSLESGASSRPVGYEDLPWPQRVAVLHRRSSPLRRRGTIDMICVRCWSI